MKKAIVVTGGYINPDKINISSIEYDISIAADSGYLSAKKLGITPDIIVGDFDSAPKPICNAEIITLPPEKDFTDTMIACDIAIKRGAVSILILGGTGGRADHFLSNVFSLASLKDQGISATLTDGENTISVLKDETATVCNKNGYFSLLPLGEATVTLSKCKYPLDNYTLKSDNPSFAVSNEVIGENATVSVRGTVILCESIK